MLKPLKFFIKFVILYFLLNLLSFCHSPVQVIENNDNKIRSRMVLASFFELGNADKDLRFLCEGQVYSYNDSNYVDAGKMLINNLELFFHPENVQDSFVLLPTYAMLNFNDNSQMSKVFGISGHWSIEGNSMNNIPSFDTILYVPKALIILEPTEIYHIVSKSQGFNIKWNNDEKIRDSIIISIDTLLHINGAKYVWNRHVENNGNFYIPLNEMPFIVGDTIEIALSWYNFIDVNSNKSEFHLRPYSNAKAKYIIGN